MVIDSPIVSGSYNGTGSFDQKGNVTISGSLSVTGPIIGALTGSVNSASFATTAISSSFAFSSTSSSFASNAVNATTASYVLNAVSSSFATTATSASFAATASSADIFTVRGTLTAQTINVQTITSSVDFVTGSTRFGSILSNTHQFTGSVGITGSLSVNGTSAVVGTGTTNYLPKFTGTSTIGNSLLFETGNLLGFGTASPQNYGNRTFTISASNTTGVSALVVTNSDNTRRGHIYSDGTNNLIVIGSATSTPLSFVVQDSQRMLLDSSGNLGLGVTPSAWNSSFTAMQLNGGAAIWSLKSDTRYGYFSTNTYYDAGNTLRYLGNGAAMWYVQELGTHSWWNAPINTSGAGAAATFTQAMTLDASGRLLVGFTTNQTGAALQVSGAGTFSSTLRATEITASMPSGNGALYINNASLTNKNWTFIPETSSGETNLLLFYTGASAGTRMTITSGGNVGIGTTDTQTFRLAVNGTNVDQGDTSTTIRVFDTTSATTGTGGGISFAGYTSGTSSIINTFSYIKGGKENSTAGNFASYLSFGTRVDGGAPTERMRITSGGNVLVGTTTDTGEKLKVNGTSRFSGGIVSSENIEVDATNKGLVLSKINVGPKNAIVTDVNGDLLFNSSSSGFNNLRFTGASTFSSTIQTGAPSGGTARAWKLGDVGTQALTQSRYVEVEINGTTYWLLATDVQV